MARAWHVRTGERELLAAARQPPPEGSGSGAGTAVAVADFALQIIEALQVIACFIT